mmetsp:Transcript_11783/g.35935  ORF Transcript_11783/g.35935 Transcript_11783/m.35935 type:complete len:202 (-) Transcript_11783:764-1369(-)
MAYFFDWGVFELIISRNIVVLCCTMSFALPTFIGITTVLCFAASSAKAWIYCSAMRRATASSPSFESIDLARIPSPSAVALAFVKIASDSPCALFVFSIILPSETRILAVLCPSATLISLFCSASESRIWARFLRSASACNSMAFLTPAGGEISLISYRKQRIPQGVVASLMPRTILAFSDSLSRKVSSRDSFPSSDLMVV